MSEKVTTTDFNDLFVPCYAPLSPIFTHGKGAKLWDQQQREYIDFSSGIAVSCLGHNHPKLVTALQSQAEQLWHVSNLYTNEPALRLAKKLVPASGLDRVFFCNSGAEANEAALKMARHKAITQYGETKTEILCFQRSFHGRTLFTVSAGGTAKYKENFGPLPAQIRHFPYNDTQALEQAVGSQTCAIFLEPIQGEGGVHPATQEFLESARKLATKHNAALIFDEVQTGVGRTGTLFAKDHYGIQPDIMTLAKGLGGGFPIGATLATEPFAKTLQPGTHGTTYGGNPLACAVALAVLEEIDKPAFFAQVNKQSQLLRQGLAKIDPQQTYFTEVRGKGLLLGLELSQPLADKAMEIVQVALDQGLVLLVAGSNTLRLAPPLVLTEEDLNKGLYLLEKTLQHFQKN